MGIRAEDPVAHHPDEQRYDHEAQQQRASKKNQFAANPGLDVKQAANTGYRLQRADSLAARRGIIPL
jgi:hypothetical protein